MLPGTQSFLLSSDFYLLFEIFAFQDRLVKSVVGQDRTAKVSVEKWIHCFSPQLLGIRILLSQPSSSPRVLWSRLLPLPCGL